MDIFKFLNLTLIDALDIAVVAGILWVVLRWMRNTSALHIITAIFGLFALRFIAGVIGMKMLSALMDAIINVGSLALVIIFQPEIRNFLGRMGRGVRNGGRNRKLINKVFGRNPVSLGGASVKELTQACADMAKSRTGALIIIQHRDSLSNIIDTGDRIDAKVGARLIENIFYKNSPLHDGAMVIYGNRIIAARCTLPLTEKPIPPEYGMRHKAAIGISEQSDADVIVVSEQRGVISFVSDGVITPLANINELQLKLNSDAEGKK